MNPSLRWLCKLLFAMVYAGAVIKYNVDFFRHLAPPSRGAGDPLNLGQVHYYSLPLYLAALEIASVWLVTRVWEQGRDWWIALLLFFLCQSLPTTAVFFDIRVRDFEAVRQMFEQRASIDVAAARTVTSGIRERLAAVNSELAGVKEDRDRHTASIRHLVSRRIRWDDPASLEVRDMIDLRRTREQEIGELRAAGKQITAELVAAEKHLAGVNQIQPRYDSEIAFIAANLATPKSLLSMGLAGLVPIGLLSVGFVLAPRRPTPIDTPRFDLTPHLNAVVTQLPTEAHDFYARSLVTPLMAHLATFKAVGRLQIESDHHHLNHTHLCSLAGEVRNLLRQVNGSRLDNSAKRHLTTTLQEYLEQELLPTEVAHHV